LEKYNLININMKKLIINFIIALAIGAGADLVLLMLPIDPFIRGYLCAGVFCMVFWSRKGSGLRLISEEKLVEIDKKEEDVQNSKV
jgi:hypothetical protein